jgi:hypothetical protein
VKDIICWRLGWLVGRSYERFYAWKRIVGLRVCE